MKQENSEIGKKVLTDGLEQGIGLLSATTNRAKKAKKYLLQKLCHPILSCALLSLFSWLFQNTAKCKQGVKHWLIVKSNNEFPIPLQIKKNRSLSSCFVLPVIQGFQRLLGMFRQQEKLWIIWKIFYGFLNVLL